MVADEAELKKQRKAAKRAAKEAADAAAVEDAEPEVDPAEAPKQRKAAKRAPKEAAETVAVEPEVDDVEAKKKRKAAKRAAKEAADAAAAVVEAEEPEIDEAESKRLRKAAKRAAKEAAAAAAVVEEPEVDEAEAKKQRKAAKRAAKEAAEEEEAPEQKKTKGNDGEAVVPQEGKGNGKSKGNKEFEVFVGGLPFTVTEAALKKDFEECGTVVALRLPLNDEGKPRGIAFIEFTDATSVEKALEFHETEYGGRWITVKKSGDMSKGKGKDGKDGKGKSGKGKDGKGKANKEFEVFVGGLPWSVTADVFKKDFEECGEIADFRMPLNDEGNPRGIAFIEYKNKESCEKAIKFNGTDYGGRTLSVRMSSDPPPAKGEGKGKSKGNRELEIFVGGVSRESTEESVKEIFAKCGEIVSFKLPLNDEGAPKGIAFIEYKDKDALEKALELNETEVDGRSISVKKSGDGKGEGKDGKGKGKGKKGKKGGMSAESKAARDGSIVEAAGKKQTFDDSDDD